MSARASDGRYAIGPNELRNSDDDGHRGKRSYVASSRRCDLLVSDLEYVVSPGRQLHWVEGNNRRTEEHNDSYPGAQRRYAWSRPNRLHPGRCVSHDLL